MKLIDKSALVAEIWKRRIKHREFGGSPHSEYGHEDDEILSLIDTLEVKEVDLDEEISFQWCKFLLSYKEEDSFVKVAKHFFELGMTYSKAQKGEEHEV